MKSMVLRRLIEHSKNNKKWAQSIDLVSETIWEPKFAFELPLSAKLSPLKVTENLKIQSVRRRPAGTQRVNTPLPGRSTGGDGSYAEGTELGTFLV